MTLPTNISPALKCKPRMCALCAMFLRRTLSSDLTGSRGRSGEVGGEGGINETLESRENADLATLRETDNSERGALLPAVDY